MESGPNATRSSATTPFALLTANSSEGAAPDDRRGAARPGHPPDARSGSASAHRCARASGPRRTAAAGRRVVAQIFDDLDVLGEHLRQVTVVLGASPDQDDRIVLELRAVLCIVRGKTMTSTEPSRSSSSNTAIRSPLRVHLRWRFVMTPPTLTIAPSGVSAARPPRCRPCAEPAPQTEHGWSEM